MTERSTAAGYGSRAKAGEPVGDIGPRAAAWLLLLIVVVGAALRLYGLGGGLWYDEIRTVVDSVRSPLLTMVTHFPGNNDHLFYSVLAHLSVAAFGEHAWSLRLPAALFGVAAIPMLYLLGVQVASRLEALAAAGLLAVSYHVVWYAQNARGYTLLLFATLLATYALVLAYRRDSRAMYTLFAGAAAIGAYTHLTMVLVVLSQALVILVMLLHDHRRGTETQRWMNACFGFALSGVLTLCLYAPVLNDLQSFFGSPSNNAAVATVGWAVREALDQLSIGFGAAAVVACAAAVGLVGFCSYLRRSPGVLALFVLPGPVMLITALLLGRPIFPRFFFFLTGFALLIGVRGAIVCADGLLRLSIPVVSDLPLRRIAMGFLVVGMAAVSALTLPYSYRVPKQDYAGALEYVETNASNSDRIAVIGGGAGYPYRHFYNRPWPQLADSDELTALIREHEAVWLLQTFPAYIEANQPDLADSVRRHCTLARSFAGTVAQGDIVVSVCRRG